MNFEDILVLPDAKVQKALHRIADEILAAAILGAGDEVSRKLISNLSQRRRETISNLAQNYPERTREVARMVVLREVFGDGSPTPGEPESPRRRELREFLEHMCDTHPNFIEARQKWREGAVAEHLRRLFEDA